MSTENDLYALLTDDERWVISCALSDYIEWETEAAGDYREQGEIPSAERIEAQVATAEAVLKRVNADQRPPDGVVRENGGWVAYVDGEVLAAGPDEPIIRAAYASHSQQDRA